MPSCHPDVREETAIITVTLSDLERRRLEATFKTTLDQRLRNRCQALLMAARGRRHRQIAADLSISPRPLQRWLHLSQAHGVGGLTMRWAAGRPPPIPTALAPEILSWIKASPAGCGRDRANGTSAELTTHLYRTHGLAVSERALRAFCTKHGVRPSRPTSRSLTGDPDQQDTARHALAALKKKRKPGSSCC